MKKVLVTSPGAAYYTADDISRMKNALPGAEFIVGDFAELTSGQKSELDIWIGMPSPKQLIEAKNLKWFQSLSAGVDQYLSHRDALPKDLIITSATGTYGIAISEYMIGTLLTMIRKLHIYRDQQLESHWERIAGNVGSVYGSRVLIVGLGDIGSEFAKRTSAMGAYNVGIKRTPGETPSYVKELYGLSELDKQLSMADVVALCLPGTAQTAGIMNEDRIGGMKQGAYLINVGRGSAVDCDALAKALHDGHLAGAALDVTNPEPLPSGHPLWKEQNAVITPHCAGNLNLDKTIRMIIDVIVKNLELYAAGKPLENKVDFEQGY